MSGKHGKHRKEKGPAWGFVTFVATVARLALDVWRHL